MAPEDQESFKQWTNTANAIVSLVRDDMTPLLLGAEANRIEKIWSTLWWHPHYAGRVSPIIFALSAVDIVLWELVVTKFWKIATTLVVEQRVSCKCPSYSLPHFRPGPRMTLLTPTEHSDLIAVTCEIVQTF